MKIGQVISASWARFGLGLAVLAAFTAVASGTGTRFGLWTFRTGFAVLATGVIIAAIAVMVSIGGVAAAGRAKTGFPLAQALLGLALGIATAALPAWQFQIARSVPAIHDVTTDAQNPPAFVALAADRAASPNGIDYGGSEVAAAQEAAYPDIKPLRLSMSPAQVFDAALAIARGMGWDIAAADPGEGRIEATATTLWFGFKDDIVIRVRPDASGTHLDIRSASRVGKSDVGANSRRIRAFLAKVETRLPGPTLHGGQSPGY